MNLTATIGDKLQRSTIKLLDKDNRRKHEERKGVDIEAWRERPQAENGPFICAETAGFLQQFDMESLASLAREKKTQIILHRAPGDFLVAGKTIMSSRPDSNEDDAIAKRMRDCYTQGANRTDVQDVLFLSDQLVEVLGRALSTGVNDPHTAMLCLNWLHAGLVEFARRTPAQPANSDDRVLYRRVTFEEMLNRSFDEMRQYVAADRTATLHALGVLADLALAASRQPMADACVQQMHQLATSAKESLIESVARNEIEAKLKRALQMIATRGS
jgi:uncharacterized membrane protein